MIKTLLLVITTFLALSASCATPAGKLFPEYDGVDPKAQKIVDSYLELAKDEKILFENTVTIGFKKINRGNVVGLCHYGGYFREIDVDIGYWNRSTFISQRTLLFHELTHCYCGRGHDYDDGAKYKELADSYIVEGPICTVMDVSPGFYDDLCPKSLMFPSVLEDECVNKHYNEYIKEMFQRCRPY